MSAPDYAAIRARLNAATPGPWIATYNGNREIPRVWADDDDVEPLAELRGYERRSDGIADAELIAHAPTDLAALLADNERLRAEMANAHADEDCMRSTATAERDELQRRLDAL